MNTNPKISVVIPLYNKVKYIKRALDSVLAQTYQDFEVIVVNDGSTDGSEKVVEQYTDPRIRLIHREHINSWGGYAARNLGIREARSDLIAFLDADDEWLPEHLISLVHLRGKFPEAVIWCTAYKIRSDDNITSLTFELEIIDGDGGMYLINMFISRPFCTSSLMTTRSALLAVGGFPTNRFSCGGDCYMWVRLALIGKVAFSKRETVIVSLNDGEHIWATSRHALFTGVHPSIIAAYDHIISSNNPDISDDVLRFLSSAIKSSLYANAIAAHRAGIKRIVGICNDFKAIGIKKGINKLSYFGYFCLLCSLLPYFLRIVLANTYRWLRFKKTGITSFRSFDIDKSVSFNRLKQSTTEGG